MMPNLRSTKSSNTANQQQIHLAPGMPGLPLCRCRNFRPFASDIVRPSRHPSLVSEQPTKHQDTQTVN
ncbi:hypothetical protein VTI28DRAFT_8466 [Corynascus sepedonium]